MLTLEPAQPFSGKGPDVETESGLKLVEIEFKNTKSKKRATCTMAWVFIAKIMSVHIIIPMVRCSIISLVGSFIR